jgi:hypothetical protein
LEADLQDVSVGIIYISLSSLYDGFLLTPGVAGQDDSTEEQKQKSNTYGATQRVHVT